MFSLLSGSQCIVKGMLITILLTAVSIFLMYIRVPSLLTIVSTYDSGAGRFSGIAVDFRLIKNAPGDVPARCESSTSAVNFRNPKMPIRFEKRYKSPCWCEPFNTSNVVRMRKNPYRFLTEYKTKKRARLETLTERYTALRKKNITTRLRCMPYFHIIGQPKCGTTDLFSRLSRHPQVEMGIFKETNWWTQALGRHSGAVSFSSYVDLFGYSAMNLEGRCTSARIHMCKLKPLEPCSNIVIGDGSIATFWKRNKLHQYRTSATEKYGILTVPSLMKWLLPDAKLILMLRNPTDRLFSEFLFFDRTKKLTQKNFHHRVSHAINVYNNCLTTYSDEHCAYSNEVRQSIKVGLHVGLYSVFLRRWLEKFDPEQIFVIRTEDYASSVRKSLQEVFKFLELCELNEKDESRISSKKIINQGLHKIGSMWNETRTMLDNFYQPYNEDLSKIFKDKRFLWISQASNYGI